MRSYKQTYNHLKQQEQQSNTCKIILENSIQCRHSIHGPGFYASSSWIRSIHHQLGTAVCRNLVNTGLSTKFARAHARDGHATGHHCSARCEARPWLGLDCRRHWVLAVEIFKVRIDEPTIFCLISPVACSCTALHCDHFGGIVIDINCVIRS